MTKKRNINFDYVHIIIINSGEEISFIFVYAGQMKTLKKKTLTK